MKILSKNGLTELISKIKTWGNSTFLSKTEVEQTTVLSIDNEPTENSPNLITSGGVKTAITGKVDKNQGSENVDKILVVGTDGNLTLTDMPEGGAGGVTGSPLTVNYQSADSSGNIFLTGNNLEVSLEDPTYVSDAINNLNENKQDLVTASGVLKGDGSGNITAATSGTDYATPSQVNAKQNKITASGILKGNGSGTISAAVAGTDYATPTTNLLWSGVKLMNPNTDQNITLSQAVSKQNKGIVLVFSEYNPSTNKVGNSMVSSHFVSKYEVSALSGVGHLFTTFATWGKAMAKYLYITDTTIRGHDANDNTGTATNGLLYDNTCYVLRYVIGV